MKLLLCYREYYILYNSILQPCLCLMMYEHCLPMWLHNVKTRTTNYRNNSLSNLVLTEVKSLRCRIFCKLKRDILNVAVFVSLKNISYQDLKVENKVNTTFWHIFCNANMEHALKHQNLLRFINFCFEFLKALIQVSEHFNTNYFFLD